MSAIHISRDLGDQRGKLVQRGLVVLVLGVLVGGFLLAASRGLFSSDVKYLASLDNVGGALSTGNDVKLRGAIIGTVKSIEAADDGVRVEFTVREDEAKRLPAGVTARILPATVFGTSFVDLVPPAQPTTSVQPASQVIAQDTSTETKELQDTLDRVTTILTAIEPAKVAATLGAYAQALDGRGEELGDTLETLDAYLARLEPEIPLLREDLRLLATNLDTAAVITPQVLNAADNVLTTARTVVAKRAQLTQLIAGSSALVKESDIVLASLKDDAVLALDGSSVIIEAMYDERQGFSATFRSFTELADRGTSAFGGPGSVDGRLSLPFPGHPEYSAGDCIRFGRAVADNCAGGAASAAASTAAVPLDDDVVARIRGLLDSLQQAGAASPGGVGELLARPYLGKEGDQ